jgi:hypothetical protein
MVPPFVSVVMTVHNGGPFVREAVDSILAQSWRDFEVLVVNDGSTDDTSEIVHGYRDRRVRVLDRPRGFIPSLNAGLTEARGHFIARHDADDVSLPERIASQVRYLREHVEVGVIGTGYCEIDSAGVCGRVRRLETEPRRLKWRLLFSNQFRGSAVMFQRELAIGVGGYQDRYCDDYDLWSRMAPHTELANLKEPLVRYRVWPQSHSMTYQSEVRRASLETCKSNLERLLGRTLDIESVQQLRMAHSPDDGLIEAELLQPAHLRLPLLRALTSELVERFCDANALSEADRMQFAEWVKAQWSHRLLTLANRLLEAETRVLPSATVRRGVARLVGGAARTNPRLIQEKAVWTLIAKAALGAPLARRLKRMTRKRRGA